MGEMNLFRRNDISATDKLIRIIREDDDSDRVVSPPPPVSASYVSENPSFTHKILAYFKKATIGIDIGYDRIQFVKILGNTDQNQRIEDCLSVPYDPQMPADKKRFSAFLKAHLRKIRGFSRKVELWVAIPPKEMDIRYLEIPTVPKKQISKAVPSSDRSLQLDCVKVESLVIVDQQRHGEYVPGPCTHRPSRHGSRERPKSVTQPLGGSGRRRAR